MKGVFSDSNNIGGIGVERRLCILYSQDLVHTFKFYCCKYLPFDYNKYMTKTENFASYGIWCLSLPFVAGIPTR